MATSTGEVGKASGGLEPGTVFRGTYEVVRKLSGGGMGAVYECVHLKTRKHRALKVMLPQLVEQPGLRERFELEARVTADIESDHVVETFDAGVDEATGVPFLVMELLRGDDLDTQLRVRGPLSAEETVELLAQAAQALDKTHAAGIVHRDLKPQNLFVTTRDDGSTRLKVLDFGIAKVIAESERATQHTATLGTPVYMAPEQIEGQGIGPRTDVYALGHVAYTLLVGEAYWEEENQASHSHWGTWKEIMAGVREPASLRAARRGARLPVAFDAWFVRATATVARERFDRASTLVAELAAALGVERPRLSVTGALPVARQPSVAGDTATVVLPEVAPARPRTVVTQSPKSATTTSPVSDDVAQADEGPVVLPVKSRAPFLVFAGFPLLAGLVWLGARGASREAPGTAASAVAPTWATAASTASPPAVAPAPTVETEASAPVAPSASVIAAPRGTSTTRAVAPRGGSPAKLVEAAPRAAAKPAPSCNPPFTVDGDGNKHAKPECL